MSKIVSITGAPLESVLPITPDKLFHHLRALWVARVIPDNALRLGNMVLATMQGYDANMVALTHRDAQKCYVNAPNGSVMSGPVSPDPLTFIESLQSLHFEVGMLSHKSPENLELSDAGTRHFTRSPVNAVAEWGPDTQIYFMLPRVGAEQYGETVTEKFRAGLGQCNMSLVINF